MVDGTHEIGRGDLPVGPIAYGCWRLTTGSVAEARELLETALETGMNLLDVADVYGLDFDGPGFGAAEEMVGRVLAEAPHLRDRIVLATKGGIRPGVPYDSSIEYLREACEASPRRLGVDRVDLYQLHRHDWFAEPAAVAHALDSLIADGLVADIGVSNHTPAQVEALGAWLEHPLVVNQFECSPMVLAPHHDGTLDACARDLVTPLAWSPLAGGRLASGQGVRPELVEVIDRVAAREGVDRAGVALAFVMSLRGQPIPIVGTQRPERIRAAHRATSIHLDRRDCYAMVAASQGAPLP